MNRVNQFLLDAKSRLTSYQNNEKHYVNDDAFAATSRFNDIWNAAHSELIERYSLPTFHLWEDGFAQGDATDDEVFEAKDSINAIDGTDEPAVSAEWDNEDDENIITDIYEYLDSKLLEIVEPQTDELVAEYEAWCKKQIED